jgi:hypothetical protein
MHGSWVFHLTRAWYAGSTAARGQPQTHQLAGRLAPAPTAHQHHHDASLLAPARRAPHQELVDFSFSIPSPDPPSCSRGPALVALETPARGHLQARSDAPLRLSPLHHQDRRPARLSLYPPCVSILGWSRRLGRSPQTSMPRSASPLRESSRPCCARGRPVWEAREHLPATTPGQNCHPCSTSSSQRKFFFK